MAKPGVSVEKLLFGQNSQNLGDRIWEIENVHQNGVRRL
jgi:hypothetical protein